MLIILWPWALFGSKVLIIFPMSLSVKVMLDKDLSVRFSQLVGRKLVLIINEHWLAKNELNGSAFSLKSVINLISWKPGRTKEAVSIFILKTIYFILQNMFPSLDTRSSVVHSKSTVIIQRKKGSLQCYSIVKIHLKLLCSNFHGNK